MSPRKNQAKIEVRCTDEFKEKVRVAAAKEGIPMSELMRRSLRKEIRRIDGKQESGDEGEAHG